MGFFDFLTGTKRPDKNTPILAVNEVSDAIMAINRDTAPFKIHVDESGKADLIAEWKVVDAKWYEVFGKAGFKKTFKVYLRFRDESKEVRAVDEEYAVVWKAGIPSLALAAEYFRGQKHVVEYSSAIAFTEEFKPGVVYSYRFNTKEIKKPIQQAIVACGWTYKPVAFGKL